MTWIHCNISDGSCVALSLDDGFHTDPGPDDQGRFPVSETMLQTYFHVHLNEPLTDLRHLIKPVLDGTGEMVHKFRGIVDLEAVFPDSADRDLVRDPSQIVAPVAETKNRSVITERQAIGDPIPSVAPQE